MVKESNTLVKYRAILPENLNATRRFLEEMADQGWMLKSVSGSRRFIFEKCEPKKVRYAVEVIPDGSIYDTHPTKKNEEYIDMCESIGWNFVCSSTFIYIFNTEDMTTADIESDEMQKFQTVKKAILKSRITSCLIPVILGLINICMALTIQRNNVLATFTNLQNLVLFVIIFCIGIMGIARLLFWMIKARKRIAAGGKMPDKKVLSLRTIFLLLTIFALIHCGTALWSVFRFHDMLGLVVPVIWIAVGILALVTRFALSQAEAKRIGRQSNQALTLAIGVAGGFIMIILIIAFVGVWSFVEDRHSRDISVEVTDQELTVFGTSQDISYHSIREDVYGQFLLDIRRYNITAGHRSGDDTTVDREWTIMVYHSEYDPIITRLLKDARDRKFRGWAIYFDLNHAQKLEDPRFNLYGIINESESSYEYLIHDSHNIVWINCAEPITDAQLQFMEDKFITE